MFLCLQRKLFCPSPPQTHASANSLGNPETTIHCYMASSPNPWPQAVSHMSLGWLSLPSLNLMPLWSSAGLFIPVCSPLLVPNLYRWTFLWPWRATLGGGPTMLPTLSPLQGPLKLTCYTFHCAGSRELISCRELSSCKKQRLRASGSYPQTSQLPQHFP